MKINSGFLYIYTQIHRIFVYISYLRMHASHSVICSVSIKCPLQHDWLFTYSQLKMLSIDACFMKVINNPLQCRFYGENVYICWVFQCPVRRYWISLHISFAMDRPDKRKPLTPELKGSLITLHRLGFSLADIAQDLDIHVSHLCIFFLFIYPFDTWKKRFSVITDLWTSFYRKIIVVQLRSNFQICENWQITNVLPICVGTIFSTENYCSAMGQPLRSFGPCRNVL